MTDFTLHFSRQSLEQLHSVLLSASHFLPEAFEEDRKTAFKLKHQISDCLSQLSFLPPVSISLDGDGGNPNA